MNKRPPPFSFISILTRVVKMARHSSASSDSPVNAIIRKSSSLPFPKRMQHTCTSWHFRVGSTFLRPSERLERFCVSFDAETLTETKWPMWVACLSWKSSQEPDQVARLISISSSRWDVSTVGLDSTKIENSRVVSRGTYPALNVPTA